MKIIEKGFKNVRLGVELDVYVIDGKEWFKAQDISEILEYRDTFNMIRNIDFIEENSYTHTMRTAQSNEYLAQFISEIALYECVLKIRNSDVDEIKKRRFVKAREFQRWVFGEVLPSLRKNNYYIDNENITESQKDKLIQELTCINTNGSNLLLNNKKRRLVLEQCLEDMFPETPDIYSQFLNTMKTSGMLDVGGKPTERFKEYNRLFELFHYHEDTFIETKTHFTLTNKGINHLIQTLRVVDGKLISVKIDK